MARTLPAQAARLDPTLSGTESWTKKRKLGVVLGGMAGLKVMEKTWFSVAYGHSEWMSIEAVLERVKGIEPSLSAWEAGVMPLYDTRSERLTLYQNGRLN